MIYNNGMNLTIIISGSYFYSFLSCFKRSIVHQRILVCCDQKDWKEREKGKLTSREKGKKKKRNVITSEKKRKIK